jgi:hypothetical protein
MARLKAHGISIALPRGWDGEIYRSDEEGESGVVAPVLHAGNFVLPRGRGDFGSGAVDKMGRRGLMLMVLEYDRSSAGAPLFDHPFPRAMRQREFGPDQLQRTLAGQAGAQRFATEGGRAFCIYMVLGSMRLRSMLVPELNRALETIEIDPA